MLSKIISRVFGSSDDAFVKSQRGVVKKINALEDQMISLSDDELRNKTQIFKDRLKNGETLDDLLPEAFAVVREAAKRVLGERHFDVQLFGGIALHKCMIPEMRTGEGKTLVSTLPAYLNALLGKGVHIVTVNDYLAERDAQWMGKIYKFLGLSVGCIKAGIPDDEKRVAYNSDITYATNNELGFDYLRDNLKYRVDDLVQRAPFFAIVDEVDSILIDEARTPLIISGPAEENSDLYVKIDTLVKKLHNDDYTIDEKTKNVILTEKGNESVEKLLVKDGIIAEGASMYDLNNIVLCHYVNQALKAHKIFKNNVDYIVKDGKIMIVDEFTGRILEGRRYSEGLHQALEAKERVKIEQENQTIASITFQNYFRMYPKLAGMTGTAATEAKEFYDIYGLKVAKIPTNIPPLRIDENDVVYKTEAQKYIAIVDEIKKAHEKKQPVLVGTVSIEKSEYISSMLKKAKIKHTVLNAKYHEQEAEIIAQAGVPGAVTIATNMAGRGTDIKLGGNTDMLINKLINEKGKEYVTDQIRNKLATEIEEDKKFVMNQGGLLVIGTERHESRRIDDQLRGRTGRQGDPGRTIFFLSLQDDLMRLFGSEKLSIFLTKMGLKDEDAIIHPWVTKSLQKAQQKVESNNYEARKNLLQFDDVMNEQRKVIYDQRFQIMSHAEELEDSLKRISINVNDGLFSTFIPEKSYREEWDLTNFIAEFTNIYNIRAEIIENYLKANDGIDYSSFKKKITEISENALNEHIKEIRNKSDREIGFVLQRIFLMTIDQLWKDHLHNLDRLRAGIYLRAYGQKNPLTEYKIEAFQMFKNVLIDFETQTLSRVMHLKIVNENEVSSKNTSSVSFPQNEGVYGSMGNLHFDHKSENEVLQQQEIVHNVGTSNAKNSVTKKSDIEIPRNSKCYCGSGKKYKHCHGKFNS